MKEEESNIMKAMILDVDGTLWDTTGVVAEAWMQAASELMRSRLRRFVRKLKPRGVQLIDRKEDGGERIR